MLNILFFYETDILIITDVHYWMKIFTIKLAPTRPSKVFSTTFNFRTVHVKLVTRVPVIVCFVLNLLEFVYTEL